MINKLLQIVAPHHCYGCTITGPLLCSNCKYDIIDEGFSVCIVCGLPASDGICQLCQTTYQKAWCVGNRSGVLERLLDGFKFERAKDAALPLAQLLNERLPVLPDDTVIIPVPTLSSHIRERGYDHTLLIARRFALLRRLPVRTTLQRTSKAKQRDANKSDRFRQAKVAYRCNTSLNPNTPYLLLDDVVTTNATLRYAAQALRDAGAEIIWVSVIARQPLDKSA